MEKIEKKVLNGQRISVDECLTLAADADLYSLGFLADAVRKRLHPEPIVTYVIDRNINYTDICISACKFCAFFK
ncbi:MAG: dehypoxanthine futalosine cyclase, partial [Desulfobulbaceae bacterium]|nr:dehypoxanthine futalosine cyclase [Desulfobulbaceae bacterium]